MNKVEKLEGSNCGSFSNSLHLAYHQAMMKVVTVPETLTLESGWTSIRSTYTSAVARLQSAHRVSTTYAETDDLAGWDEHRDRRVDMVFYPVDMGLKSIDPEEKAAAKAVNAVLKPYRDIKVNKYDAESADIISMIEDLREKLKNGELELLSMTDAVDKLEAVNKKFIEIRDKRQAAYTAMKNSVSVKNAREQADAALTDIADLFFAVAILTTDSEELEMLRKVIQQMNGVIGMYKETYNRSAGRKKANKKKDDEKPDEETQQPDKDPDKEPEEKPDESTDPEQPTDPDESTDPDTPEQPDEGEEDKDDEEGGGTHFEPVP